MVKTILINGVATHVHPKDTPLIIHGADGNGASLFSISLIADLYAQGIKLLFISGYPMARDEFKAQTSLLESDMVLVQSDSDCIDANTKSVIFVPFEQSNLFIRLLCSLPDIEERIVFFKNFDLFDASIFDQVRAVKHYVLQGDIHNCSYSKNIAATAWATRIYFSEPPQEFDTYAPDFPKYTGFIKGKNMNGVAVLQ